MKRTYTSIPVSLCEFALVNRKINQVKLYIYLKLISDGYVVMGNGCRYKQWSDAIGVHEKTVKSSFKWLVQQKWITVNSNRNAIRIISYKNLSRKLGLNLKTGYLCEVEQVRDFKQLKALCCAIVITYYLDRKRFFDKRQSGRITGRPITNCKKKRTFYPMPNSYLAHCTKVSIATAYRYKHEAKMSRLIKTKSNDSILETLQGEKISLDLYSIVLKGILNDEQPNRLKKGKNCLKWEEATLIKSNLITKKKEYVVKGKN